MNDPVVVALAGAIVTLAGLYYRNLLAQIAELKTEVMYWRKRYFGAMGRAELAVDEAAKRADE